MILNNASAIWFTHELPCIREAVFLLSSSLYCHTKSPGYLAGRILAPKLKSGRLSCTQQLSVLIGM